MHDTHWVIGWTSHGVRKGAASGSKSGAKYVSGKKQMGKGNKYLVFEWFWPSGRYVLSG